MIDRRTACALVLLGQCLDALTFVLFFTIVPLSFLDLEMNPITRLIVGAVGLGGFAAMKIGLGLVVVLLGERTRHTKLVGGVAMVGFVGAAANVAALAALR